MLKASRLCKRFPTPEMATAADMISARFFHALGYHVYDTYLVSCDMKQLVLGEDVRVTDKKGKHRRMTHRDILEILLKVPKTRDGKYRALASLQLPGKPHGVVMLICIAALPLKPLQTLALGLSITASQLAILLMAPSFGHFAGSDPLHVIWNLVVTFICTALTAVMYAQRSAAYRSRQQALRSFEDLRMAQARLLLSETAASQGRLAAALSHELNSPIGAVSSAVETMVLLYKKRQEADQAKLAGIFDLTLPSNHAGDSESWSLACSTSPIWTALPLR